MDKLRELLPPTDVNLVLYHGHCSDGFGAAWVAHTVLNTKAEYVGVSYGKQDQLSQFVITKETNVLLVDYSFDLETCQKIKEIIDNINILSIYEKEKKKVINMILDLNITTSDIEHFKDTLLEILKIGCLWDENLNA
jgi:hypothetical protein